MMINSNGGHPAAEVIFCTCFYWTLTLYEDYSKYGYLTQNAIICLATSNYHEIISRKMNVDDLLLSKLLQSDDINNREHKIELLINSMKGMQAEACNKHFGELGLEEFKRVFTRNGARIKYEISDEATKIFTALKENNLIYNFTIDEANPEKYIISKRNSKKNELLD